MSCIFVFELLLFVFLFRDKHGQDKEHVRCFQSIYKNRNWEKNEKIEQRGKTFNVCNKQVVWFHLITLACNFKNDCQ